jgi:large subunit ribosomal protein L30
MKRIRITLIKSVIDRSETAKRTVTALGLNKLNSSVEVEATPQILGMVRRAGHLLKVEEIASVEAAANEVAA